MSVARTVHFVGSNEAPALRAGARLEASGGHQHEKFSVGDHSQREVAGS